MLVFNPRVNKKTHNVNIIMIIIDATVNQYLMRLRACSFYQEFVIHFSVLFNKRNTLWQHELCLLRRFLGGSGSRLVL